MIKLIFGVFCLIASLSAEIRHCPNLSPLYEEISQCNSNTLFLVDIGGTLLTHKDPALHVNHNKWRNRWFKKNYPSLTAQEKIALACVVEETHSCWILTDNWPDLLEKAHQLKVKTIAFTQVLMDPSLENVRIERLHRFGLFFQDELEELPYKHELFCYKNGVIQTGQKWKGSVLKEVLGNLKELPLKILFVDDKIEQIKSVEKICKEMNISFVGFHYIDSRASPDLDETIAHKKLETLVKEHRWL